MLLSSRRLRVLWRAVYELVLRCTILLLRKGAKNTSAYLKGSLARDEAVYGLSDIDLVFLIGGTELEADEVRNGLQRRWRQLTRWFPPLRHIVAPVVWHERDLAEASTSSSLTYGLVGGGLPRLPASSGLLVRPEAKGPAGDWRLVAGRERRPAPAPRTRHEELIAAWLELQRWWRPALRACDQPEQFRGAYLWTKLIAQPAAIWLWLVHGEKTATRRNTLELARDVMGDEDHDALERALELEAKLPSDQSPPLEDALAWLVALSCRLATFITEEVEDHGRTDVDLLGGGTGELIVLPEVAVRMEALRPGSAQRMLPLVDWRARVLPSGVDETFCLFPWEGTRPPDLVRGAVETTGCYGAKMRDGILVLPATTYRGALLRCIQFSHSDPVSFALSEGRRSAAFPNVDGWSALDCARRATAEHRRWLLSRHRPLPRTAIALERLLSAVRASLFLQSVQAGEPQLPLTLGAAAEHVEAVGSRARRLAQDAVQSYRAARLRQEPPDRRLVGELQDTVLQLPCYSNVVNHSEASSLK